MEAFDSVGRPGDEEACVESARRALRGDPPREVDQRVWIERNAGFFETFARGRDAELVDAVHYFSHWITPVGPPRRFDTRFFVARAPEGHTYLHDERETIDNAWVRPADAIERQQRGEVDIIFPTLRTLDAIGRFATTDDLITAAAAIESVPVMLPRVVQDHDGTRILLPGDEGYEGSTG